MPTTTDLRTVYMLLPEIILATMALWVFIAGTFVQSRTQWTALAAALDAVAAFALWRQSMAWGPAVVEADYVISVTGPLLIDFFGLFWRWFSLVAGLVLLLTAARSCRKELVCELLGCLMLMTVGSMLVAASGELVTMFLGLELISIPTYVVLFLGRGDRRTSEATMKYFFLSIVSSAVLLYGFSFLYGVAGSLRLDDIHATLSRLGEGTAPTLPVALVLIFAGLGFKIAAVPFQFYAPDVYEGATNAAAGLLSVVPKVAGIVALARIVVASMPGLEQLGWHVALALSLLTMTVGNVAALWQTNVRRMMAYSSIAHAGYMLMGLAAGLAIGSSSTGPYGIAAMLFYVVVYVLATVSFFAALAYLSGPERQVNYLNDLAGVARRHPVVAAAIAVSMFSLTGLPPLAGFWGKLSLFTSTLDVAGADFRTLAEQGLSQKGTWFVALAVVGVLNAAISAAYYLRVVGMVFFRGGDRPLDAEGGNTAWAAMVVSTALVIAVGVWPAPVDRNSRAAALSLQYESPRIRQSDLRPTELPPDHKQPQELGPTTARSVSEGKE